MPRLLRKRDAQSGGDGQQARLGGNDEMGQRDIREMALHHQHEAYSPGLDGLVPAEHQPKLLRSIQEMNHVLPS